MPKPVKKGNTKAKKRPSSDPMTRARQLQDEHMAKVAGANPPWAGSTATIDERGRVTMDPPGRSVMEPTFAEQLSAHMRALGAKGGKIGGKRRLETMTQERRDEIALKAANARWAKHRAKKD